MEGFYLFLERVLFKLAISTAENAASAPLFPALEPALSIACSKVSVVITPEETGISLSSPIVANWFVTVEAKKSKCEV